MSKPTGEFLDTHQLAERWDLDPMTLQHWRSRKCGPAYIKLGKHNSKVLYALKEVVEYENLKQVIAKNK